MVLFFLWQREPNNAGIPTLSASYLLTYFCIILIVPVPISHLKQSTLFLPLYLHQFQLYLLPEGKLENQKLDLVSLE